MLERESELIVTVNEQDVETGEAEKNRCHDGEGLLHRGFLAMVFNHRGELLLTRRSPQKRLWPGFWDGSVASHVFKGEDYVQATGRRLRQELGITADTIEYAFKFRYKAGYGNAGTEHEICAVTMVRGIEEGRIAPNGDEISDMRFADLKALIEEVRENGRPFTPWLVLALAQISERPMAGGEVAIPCGPAGVRP